MNNKLSNFLDKNNKKIIWMGKCQRKIHYWSVFFFVLYLAAFSPLIWVCIEFSKNIQDSAFDIVLMIFAIPVLLLTLLIIFNNVIPSLKKSVYAVVMRGKLILFNEASGKIVCEVEMIRGTKLIINESNWLKIKAPQNIIFVRGGYHMPRKYRNFFHQTVTITDCNEIAALEEAFMRAISLENSEG